MKTAALVLAMVMGLGVAVGARADVLETREGRILEGRFLGGTQQSVRFEIGGNVEVFPVGDVLALTFTKSPASQAATRSATPPPAATAQKEKARAATPEPSGTAPAKASRPRPKNAAPAPSSPAAAEATGAEPAPAAAAPAPAKAAQNLRVEAGTRLLVRMADTVDPRRVTEGDRFAATLDGDVAVDGRVVAPARSKVYGTITEAKPTGPASARLKLELTELMIQGQMFSIVTGTQKVVAAHEPAADEAPAKATPGPVSGRVASGALLEFRLLQPFELRTR